MKALLVAAGVAAFPTEVLAQAAIAGSTTDRTGAPIPEVTVEVRSPALIERVRSTATDVRGRFRIENLRPGIYSVIFRLTGWRPRQLDGIELTGTFTAYIDAVLEIGSAAETITVLGEMPVVDVRAAAREATIAGEVVRSIPTARTYNALLPLVPGVVTNLNDTVTSTTTASFPIHGGRTNEGRLLLDGFNIGSPPNGNSAASYSVDVGDAQEVIFTTAGGLGEAETAGLVMNVVPRSGGNTRHGSFYASGTAEWLQSDNLTQSLKDQGLTASTNLTGLYDVSGTFGGPLLKDRAWYFVNAHRGSARREVANVHYNLNAGDPSRWLYAPDVTRREYSDRIFENASARVTWQVTPRNRITGFWDAQALCRTCTGATPGLAEPAQVAPEAVGVLGRPLEVWQATWWSPVADRWILEAGFSGTSFGVGNFERSPNPTRDLVRVVEQCASGCAANGGIAGLVYRSQDFSDAHTASYLWKGSASYVTGSSSLKIGYQHTLMTDDRTWMTNSQNLTYRFNNGVPNQLTQSISAWVNDARAAWQALFVQEEWTYRRLTLQGALRFDRAWSWFPVQREGPSRFLPTPIVVPSTRGVDSYKDITPRLGVAYDVTGHGRTAIRASLGKYLDGVGVSGNYANTNPTLRMPQTTSVFGTAGVTRAWNDANQNFSPDCDLLNPAAQDLRSSGGDLCGVLSDTNFGKYVLTNNFDPAILTGWGVRPSDWRLDVSIQQQIGARASVNATYVRRWYDGFFAVDNGALQPSDLTPYSVVAPLDPRLPGGGGYVVSDLYDVVPEKSGQVDNFVTASAKYGRWRQYFNGLDVILNVRPVKRFAFMGGTSTGQTVADSCEVRARLPEFSTTTTGTSAFGAGLAGSAVSPTSPYCHVAYGVLTQLRGFASFIVPKAEVQLSATFQSRPGPMLAANYAAPNSAVAPRLGRNLSGSAPNVTVNLVEPGTMYGDRINQVDLRIGKTFKYRRARTLVAIDLYNAANSSAVLTYNNAFVPGGTWLQPLTILTPRFVRITTQIDF